MKRMWVQLSFAFSGVLILSQLVSFITLVGLAYYTPAIFVENFASDTFAYRSVGFWVDGQFFSGMMTGEQLCQEDQPCWEGDGAEVIELMTQIENEIKTLRSSEPRRSPFLGESVHVVAETPVETTNFDVSVDPFCSAEVGELPVDGNFTSFNLPLALFYNNSTIGVIIQSVVIGIIAGVLTSRYLVKPLSRLNEAVQAFGQRDMGQRVQVKGSREIEDLMHTFNHMADELEHTEQLRMNIFADVSHELRTPLTGLEGSLRASLDRVYEIDEKHIANMLVQTQHLIHLVEDLRLLAQAEARKLPLKSETVDVNQLVQDTIDMFSIQAEESGIELLGITPSSPLIVECDMNRIRQVLHNLISNALRYTEKNGCVRVIVEQCEDYVLFSVQDDGEGIDVDQLSNVFDRFYRIDKSRSRNKGGTGLGLAIVKALVEAHDGTVDVLSDGVGFGSTFRFSIPYHSKK